MVIISLELQSRVTNDARMSIYNLFTRKNVQKSNEGMKTFTTLKYVTKVVLLGHLYNIRMHRQWRIIQFRKFNSQCHGEAVASDFKSVMTLQVAHFSSDLECRELQVFSRQARYPISGVTWRLVIVFSHLDRLVPAGTPLEYSSFSHVSGFDHVSRSSDFLKTLKHLGRASAFSIDPATWKGASSCGDLDDDLIKSRFLWWSIWNLRLGYSQVRSKFPSLELDFCPLTLRHLRHFSWRDLQRSRADQNCFP